MGIFLESLHKKLLGHGRIVLSPSLELQCFKDIELPAEEHEAVDGKRLQGMGDIVEGSSPFVLILNGEPAVVIEDDFELMEVEMHHFQRFLQHHLLLLQGELPK